MLLEFADRADEACAIAGKAPRHRDEIEGLLGLAEPIAGTGANVSIEAFVNLANRAMT